jgi:hypothetical protein
MSGKKKRDLVKNSEFKQPVSSGLRVEYSYI